MGLVGVSLLGEYLVKKGLITEEQLVNALRVQKQEGIRLGSALIKLGYLNEGQLIKALGNIYGYPIINLTPTEVDITAFKLIPKETINKYKILPFLKTGNTVKVAICEPNVVEHIKFLLAGYNVEIYLMKESDINKLLSNLLIKDNKDQKSDAVLELVESAVTEITQVEEDETKQEDVLRVEAPIITLANRIIIDAIKMRASDIHIEPYEKYVRVRYRIDGVLQNIMDLPSKIKGSLITRLKIMSHLDISERRLPQDGRIKMRIGEKEVDFRVSTLPTIYGEKVVLRVLEKGNLQLDLTKLGFEEISLKFFLEALEHPYGMILVTGPTGSGKTTTLYSALMKLNTPEVNIMTAEDPVEYNFPGINQVHVREDIGLTFASALRSFLRQDPDIIMVGEIRDYETAEIAVKAALTGHLVLSTLHTNDAPSTITRLINMGIEPFLISSSVILVVAQRLVRKLCPKCKKEETISSEALLKIGVSKEKINGAKIYGPQGCSECNNTGYRGRIALYEVMPITDTIKELIVTGATAEEIKKEAINAGMLTLRQSGIQKLLQGLTSVKEVLRVTAGD